MPGVLQHKKWLVEKNLLSLELIDVMFFRVLTGITFIPFKPRYVCPVNHICILPSYTFLTREINKQRDRKFNLTSTCFQVVNESFPPCHFHVSVKLALNTPISSGGVSALDGIR